MHTEILKKTASIVEANTISGKKDGPEPYCALALIDESGYPTASTITPSKAEGLQWITFCTSLTCNKGRRAQNCDRACAMFNTEGKYNITLVGTIEVITDPAVKQEMWYEGMENYFSGPSDPDYCVLRFTTQRYSLFVDHEEASGTL